MSKAIFVTIDIGCIECGVDSVLVGAFLSREDADKAALDRPDWRDGGQSSAQVFEVVVPKGKRP